MSGDSITPARAIEAAVACSKIKPVWFWPYALEQVVRYAVESVGATYVGYGAGDAGTIGGGGALRPSS